MECIDYGNDYEAYSLGYLSSNQYSYLMRQMSTRGYRQIEPLDNSIEYKHPCALKQSINLLLTKGNMSGNDILNLFSANGFSLSANVIEELLNLESGTLLQASKAESNIIEFPSI